MAQRSRKVIRRTKSKNYEQVTENIVELLKHLNIDSDRIQEIQPSIEHRVKNPRDRRRENWVMRRKTKRPDI